MTNSETPVTKKGLRSIDDLDPLEAALLAWTDEGNNRIWHGLKRARMRREMPLVARALDRAAGYGIYDSLYGKQL